MDITTELSEKQQMDFAVIYGTLFSLSTTMEYLDTLKVLLEERKANYAMNKARQAENFCGALMKELEREMTKRMTPEEKAVSTAAIEYHKQLIYDFFMMDPTDQKRIRGLMEKLKRDK